MYAVLDNWSVHFHPDGVESLVPQQFAADFRIPPHWSGAAVGHLQAAVCAFWDDLRDGSSELLRRARLGAGIGLYGEAFTGGS